MPTFDAQKLPITDEEAIKHLTEIRDDEKILREAKYKVWDARHEAYEYGIAGSPDQGLQLISTTVQSLLPYIFHADPSIRADVLKEQADGETKAKGKKAAALLEHEWEETDDFDEVSAAVLDAMIYDTGWGRVAYSRADLFVPPVNYDTTTYLDELFGAQGKPKDSADLPRAVFETLDERLREQGLAVDRPTDHAVIERISPYNLIPPAGYTKVKKFPHFTIRHPVHIDDLRHNPRFGHPKDIEPNLVLQSGADGEERFVRFLGGANPATHVAVYEKWYRKWARRRMADGKYRWVREFRVLHLIDQAGDSTAPIVLKHRLSELDMDGWPIAKLTWEDVPKSLYGISVVGKMLPLARHLEDLMQSGVRGMKAALALKVLFLKDKMGKNGEKLLKSSKPQMVPVKDRRSAKEAAHVLNLPAFPQEFHGLVNLLKSFMSEVSGSDEAMRGGRSSADSATEVAVRASAMRGQTDSKLKRFERFLNRLLRMKFALMQQFYDAARWAIVDGEPQQWTREEIKDSYAIRIHSGSTAPSGPDAERAGFVGFLQALSEATAAGANAGFRPEAIQKFQERVLELWDQDGPELRDAFAQAMHGMAAGAGSAAPVASGNAVNPMTDQSLNTPTPAEGALAGRAAEAASPPN